MLATGASPWMGISTASQPRAKRKLDRAQPQEKGRHRSCVAPTGLALNENSKPRAHARGFELYRRSAAKQHNENKFSLAAEYEPS